MVSRGKRKNLRRQRSDLRFNLQAKIEQLNAEVDRLLGQGADYCSEIAELNAVWKATERKLEDANKELVGLRNMRDKLQKEKRVRR